MEKIKHTYIILSFLSLLCFFSCREMPADKSKMLGKDFRLYQGTVAWDLAKAVEDQDVMEIIRQVRVNKVPVDYREERFGGTLLMMAVRTNKISSVKALLELGAAPNIPNDTIHNFGRNAVIFASEFSTSSPKILKLLLEYGGNPNSVCRGEKQDNHGNWIPMRAFALDQAIPLFGDFEKVRILVEAGADVNMQQEGRNGALYTSILLNRMDVLWYLLEHGADFNQKFERTDLDSPSYSKKFQVDILYELRLCIYPLDSKEYKDKLKVIEFLSKRGLDYWASPLPKDAIDIINKEIKPNNEQELQEYIRKY